MATLAGVGVLSLLESADFMNFEAACGAGFLHVRRAPSEKDCHSLLLCFSASLLQRATVPEQSREKESAKKY